MTYTYNDQNQVTGIVDASMTNKGFRVVPRTSTANTVDYEYDLNGNMTKDANKGIFLITYNHLDLPTRVEFGDQSPDGRMIEYMYSAGGQKLKKTVYKDGQVIKDVEYVGGIEYENTQATRIQHAEGSIVLIPEGRGHDKNNYQYEWVLRDHLGNTRVTFTNDDDDGVVKAGDISQENHYYPYGMNMEGPWNGVAGKNNYQLTGKEFENDFDLGWSDHGMRRYDPAMARWTSADPLMGVFADMSPYNYVMGNPVGLVDLDGAKSSNSNKYFANGKGGGPMTYIYTYEIQHYIWVPPVPAQAHVFNTGDGSGDAVPGYWKEGAVETFVIIDIPIEQNESGSDNLDRGLPNGTAAPLGASGGGTVTGGDPTIAKLNRIAREFDSEMNKAFDKSFLEDGKKVEEWAGVFTESAKGIYLQNLHTDHSSEFSFPTEGFSIKNGETAIGVFHTHPYNKITEGFVHGAPFSGADISIMRGNSKGYISLVEAGTRRFALVIEDIDKANSFFSIYSSEQIQDMMATFTFINTNLGKKSFKQAISDSIKVLLNNSGIGYYRTNDDAKKSFIKLNFNDK
jgi:RHS repeat-associated protein